MQSDHLTLISHTVLALIGRHGASPHDLVRMMRRGRIYHAAAASQYYAESKRLERLGLLTSSKEPGRTRERTVYRLTEAGVAALEEWVGHPSPFPRLAGEPPARIISAEVTGEGAVRDREKYLLLNVRLAEQVLNAYERWLDEVDQELAPERESAARRPA